MKNVQDIKLSFDSHPLHLIDAGSGQWMNALLQLLATPEVSCELVKLDEHVNPDLTAVSGDENEDGYWPVLDDDWMHNYRPYVVEQGVLNVPVRGSLMHDFDYSFGKYLTGYPYLTRLLKRGEADPQVTSYLFEICSMGGHAEGNFDMHDAVVALTKPAVTFATHAYSAAYNIACATNHITVSRTGGVGSVGVVLWHTDISKSLEQEGVKMTPIFAGARKIDGNYFTPLSESAKKRMQSSIDDLYGMFTERVAAARGMSVEAVVATEADCYGALEAVEIGFADEVGTLQSVFSSAVQSKTGVSEMSKDAETIDLTAHKTALASATEAGRAEGVQAERTRISTILGSDAGKANLSAAITIATTTALEAEAAEKLLVALPAAPVAEAPKGNAAFAQAMADTNVTLSNGKGEEDQGGEVDLVQSTLNNFRQHGGTTLTKQ